MLTYEYRCTKCHHVFECVQRVGDPAPPCSECGSPTRKVYSSVGLIFKGKGFHTTDYRKPAPADNGEAKAPVAKDAAAKDAAKPSSSKDTAAGSTGSSTDAPAPSSTSTKQS